MNRLIKFRAWIYSQMIMISQEDFHDYTMICNGNGFGVVNRDTNEFLKDDDFSVMQYTGLKDKNGKEIYEGDVVTFKRFYGERKLPIEFDPLRGFRPYMEGYGGFEWNPIEVEVIGNIYENPELIKQ